MAARKSIHLIVNADDYAYFPSVSRGILDAASAKRITATGIIANGPDLTDHLAWLDFVDRLDLGVHLNLTAFRPLTAKMADKLVRYDGAFPSVYDISLMILRGQIAIGDVRQEWSAQIEACRGRKLMFLNSHEHIHMLPVLFPLTLELAQKYRIPYVRQTKAEWLFPMAATALVRNTVMQCLHTINRRKARVYSPTLLGLNKSGKLDFDYLEKVFSTLRPGKSYELMCHPGYFDANQIQDAKLIKYHRWKDELELLCSQELEELYERFGICLGYYQI